VTELATSTAEPAVTPAEDHGPSRSERWSATVFGVAVGVALPLLLWFGRDHWFFLDDWWVLTRDGLTGPGYLDGHNGHWITLVRVDNRLIFEWWGLRSYLPYQIPVVLAHLAAAVLMRQVTLRLGVRAWIATAVALAFLFFGSGRENILWGHEVGATTSLVCGFGLFLLADGGRSVTRRDVLGLAVGVLGLMTWGSFPAILFGFCLTTLLRRGARVAAFYGLPLGAIYATWYVRYSNVKSSALEPTQATFRFAGKMLWGVFDALARGGVGVVLLVVAGLGLLMAARRAWRSRAWAALALPLGLAAAWAAFAGLTSLARAVYLPDSYRSERYLHIGAALGLPLVAAGAEALARRRALLGAAALVPLAIGLPGNLDLLSHTKPILRGNPELVFATAHSAYIDDVPPDTPVLGGPIEIPLTAGWLARQVDAGRVPEPAGADPVRDLDAAAQLVLAQGGEPAGVDACPQVTAPQAVTLREGEQIRFAGPINVATTNGARESHPLPFDSRAGAVVGARAGPVDVVLRPALGQELRVCVPRATRG
jgi:hypothetical protein